MIRLSRGTQIGLSDDSRNLNRALKQAGRGINKDPEYVAGMKRVQQTALEPARRHIARNTPVDDSGRKDKRSGHRRGGLRRSVDIRSVEAKTGAIVSFVGYQTDKRYGQRDFVSKAQVLAIETGTRKIRAVRAVRNAYRYLVNTANFRQRIATATYRLWQDLAEKSVDRQPPNRRGKKLRYTRRPIV